MAENKFQQDLVKELKDLFPGCEIIKNDPNYRQGILDLLILYGKKWAMLEVKASDKAKFRPNQPYFIKRFHKMSFAAMICPENKREVLAALEKALSPRRQARVS